MAASLASTLCGIPVSNLFGLASAPRTQTYDQLRRARNAGFGFAECKTIPDQPTPDLSSRYAFSPDEKTMENIEVVYAGDPDGFLRDISVVTAEDESWVVGMSLMARYDQDIWRRHVEKCVWGTGVTGIDPKRGTGVKFIAVNVSCPHGLKNRGMGKAMGLVPEIVADVVRWTQEVVGNMPILVKLTPNGDLDLIVEVARTACKLGAHITAANTMNGVVEFDHSVFPPPPHARGAVPYQWAGGIQDHDRRYIWRSGTLSQRRDLR